MSTIILPRDANHEFVKVMTHATVEKRDDRYEDYVRSLKAKGLPITEVYAKASKGIEPYETVVGDYNAMVDNGINALLLLLVGGGGTAFNTGNAYLAVGSSTVVWGTTQTALTTQLGSRMAMQSGTYPQTGTKLQTFKSDWTGSAGDGAWNEWGIFNASTAGTMLNRKVEVLGTKSGGTWTLTVTFALS